MVVVEISMTLAATREAYAPAAMKVELGEICTKKSLLWIFISFSWSLTARSTMPLGSLDSEARLRSEDLALLELVPVLVVEVSTVADEEEDEAEDEEEDAPAAAELELQTTSAEEEMISDVAVPPASSSASSSRKISTS